jgi:hypothetical protein
MIPKDCQRLAEVDFPIAVVSRHFRRGRSPSGVDLVAFVVGATSASGMELLRHLDPSFCHLDRSGEISRRQARFPPPN